MALRYWFPEDGETVEDARESLIPDPWALAEYKAEDRDGMHGFSMHTVVEIIDEAGDITTMEVEGRLERSYYARSV